MGGRSLSAERKPNKTHVYRLGAKDNDNDDDTAAEGEGVGARRGWRHGNYRVAERSKSERCIYIYSFRVSV